MGGAAVTTRYAYDGDRAWAELDSTNNVQFRYLNGDGATQVFARINVSGSSVAWLLADRLGSIRDVADATQVNDHVEFTPFGDIASESNSTAGVTQMFQGMQYDRVSKLGSSNSGPGDWQRETQNGRWIQEDHAPFPGGEMNPRRFVGNDPTNFVDATGFSGHAPWTHPATSALPFDITTKTFYQNCTQWGMDDCWFVAAVAGYAHARPQEFKNLLKDNGDGTYTVTFGDTRTYSQVSGLDSGGVLSMLVSPTDRISDPVRVRPRLIGSLDDVTNVLETAAALKGLELHCYRGPGQGAGIEMLTGHNAVFITNVSQWWAGVEVRRALQLVHDKHKIMIAGTGVQLGNRMPGILPKHVYTVLDYFEGSDIVVLRDPAPTSGFPVPKGREWPIAKSPNPGEFWVSRSELMSNCMGFSIEARDDDIYR
jgi:RHS repeat-associated protein